MRAGTTRSVGTALRRLLAAVGWWEALTTPGPTRVLALNALVDAAGTGLAAVCLPFFAVTVAGLDAAGLALVLSVVGGCELVAAVPNGALAGRYGVWRVSIVTKLVQALAYLVLAALHGFVPILLVTAVAGLARAGASGLNQSLTVAVLREEERSGALGVIRALRNIGYLASGAAGAVVLAAHSAAALRVALLVNGVSFLFGAACVVRLRPPVEPATPDRTDFSVLRDWTYLGLIVSAAVFGSSLVVLDIGLPLWVIAHDNVPRWSVAVVVVVNTALVVLLQYRFAQRVDTVPRALTGIRRSAVAFGVMAVLVAVAPGLPALAAVGVLLLAAVVLTAGEMWESPSWWTVSYELAPPARRNEYLSAFDLSWAVVGILGPAAMAAVVAGGARGWLLYGATLLLAAVVASWLVRTRAARVAASTPVQPAGALVSDG